MSTDRPAPRFDDERAGTFKRTALIAALAGGASGFFGPDSDLGAIASGLGEGSTEALASLDADYQQRVAGHQAFLDKAQRYNLDATASEREMGYRRSSDLYEDVRDRTRELSDDERDRKRKLTDDEREQQQALERTERTQQLYGERERETARFENKLARESPTFRDLTARQSANTSSARLAFEKEKEGLMYQQGVEDVQAEIETIERDIQQATTPTERRGLRKELREAEARKEKALRALPPSQRRAIENKLAFPGLYGEGGVVERATTVTENDLRMARQMLDAGELTQEEYDILLADQ